MNSVKTKKIQNLEKKMKYEICNYQQPREWEKKKKGGGRKKKYDPYTNEMVRKTRCATQSRTDNLYNLKMNDQRGQL